MIKKTVILCMFLFQAFFGRVDAASTLLGTIGPSVLPPIASSTLVKIDQSTGAATVIGNIGYAVNGLAYDPTTGILYGSTTIADPNHNGLITIDLETGAGTPIGLEWLDAIVTIEFNSTGQLYGWNPGFSSPDAFLVLIDKSNGDLTPQSSAGIGETGATGLAFDLSGTLWLYVGNTFDPPYFTSYIVNPNNGNAGMPIQTGFDSTLGHHGKFNPDDGLYWGITQIGNANPRDIARFDLAAGTVLGQIDAPDFLQTLVFIPSLIDPVPFVKGTKVENRFPTQSEFVNKINWGPSPSSDVVAYRIYRNGELIAEVPVTQLCYNDHNQPKCTSTIYAVTAVDENGAESDPVEITIE